MFDLLYTLVHPGEFPGGGDRTTWLAGLLGVDEQALESKWSAFEPLLESGQAPATPPFGPELTWLTRATVELGNPVEPEALSLVQRDWDLTCRRALLDPPAASVDVLVALRSANVRIGVLSNTHALELRAWPDSPLAGLVDAVAFSHEIGAVKPTRAAYDAILDRLGVSANAAAYVGDGSNDELVGAREAGFAAVILAAEAPTQLSPGRLDALQAQADHTLSTLADLPTALSAAGGPSIG